MYPALAVTFEDAVSPPPAAATPRLDRRVRELFDVHADFVWRSLMRLGLGAAAAEDALQDVFVVVHRKLETFEERGLERAWLFAIARRVARDHRRAADRARKRLEGLEPLQEPAGSPEDQVLREQAARIVGEFLESLDAERRTVFHLAEIEGLSGPEIAVATGENVNTVYTRLRAARRLFAAWVDQRGVK